MDTKSMYCKHPKKMKPSDDKNEIFVLPPNLLEKLGVTIGNNGSQVFPDDENGLPSTAIVTNEQYEQIKKIMTSSCSQRPSDTSILETASLMKKSVFLSPTFVSTINAIPGEVEIASKNTIEDSVAVSNLLEPQDSHSNDIIEGCHKEDQYNNCLNEEQTYLSNSNQSHPCLLLDGNENPVLDINMTFDKNTVGLERKNDNISDDSFQRDSTVRLFSNSTKKDSDFVSSNHDTNNITPPISVSKVDINAEDSIPLSKLREIKRSIKKPCLNGKRNKPVTVKSIAESKITIDNGISELQNIMKPNSAVPLQNTKVIISDFVEVQSQENSNQSNFESMNSNKLRDTTADSLNDIEVVRTDIISNKIDNINSLRVEQNLRDISMNRAHTDCESEYTAGKSSENYKDKNKGAISECYLYNQKKALEDHMTANAVTVNDLRGDEEPIETINVDKSVTNCNSRMNGTGPTEDDGMINQRFLENEHKCHYDKTEQVSHKQNETGIAEHMTAEFTIKQKSNTKKRSNSKITKDIGCGVKKITGDKISSSNVESESFEHHDLTSILNATKKLSSNVTDIKVDKVKEIAAYLRKFSHIYTDKKKTKKALSNDITKKETVNSNTHTIESKLCIQGVEKPGGHEVDREPNGECRVLKTYSRRNLPKASKLPTILHKNETTKTVALNLDNDAVNISKVYEIQEFCLCDDFGRLAYYDHDNVYEHIHFWHHRNATCELDLIFAIYSDEAIVRNSENGLEKEEKTEDKIENYNLCWNIFQSELNESIENSDIELKGQNYVIDELKDTLSGDSPQVTELNIAEKVDDGIVSKTQDEIHLENNSHSDIILETVDHDMVDVAEAKKSDRNVEKPLNTDIINDNKSAAAVSELANTCLSSSQIKLTATIASKTGSPEICNVLKKPSIQEKTNQRRQSSSIANTSSIKEVKSDSSTASNKAAPKRRLSEKAMSCSEPSSKKSVKCGLCNNIFSDDDWEQHVANQHHLIAWRAGSSINLDDPNLEQKLKDRLKTIGVLECTLCNKQYKQLNRFLDHMKYCIQKLSNADKKTDKPARKSRSAIDDSVTCGVCQRSMPSTNWLEHIGSLHDYLAWKQGQDPLDLDKESEVWQHLQNIIRLNGSLTCYKCGLQRSRVKTYLAHTKTCNGTKVCLESSMSVDLNSSSNPESSINGAESAEASTVKCGVCEQDVTHSDWIEHISINHNYLAWQKGETPLDLDDEETVRNHLQQFIRHNGGLTCHKCGLVRKRVKLYLTHMETCDGTNSQIDNSSNNISLNSTARTLDLNVTAQSTDQWFEVPVENEERKVVKCGVCGEEVPILEWIQHIGKEHGYLAWQDGAAPLDLENEAAVKVHLLEVSKQGGGLACNKCEKRMKYPKTYQQHIKECTGPSSSPESKLEISTSSWIESLSNKEIKDEILTCAVCANKVESDKWISHIETEHQYLAWVEGQPPLNLEDAVMVQKHLNDVSKVVGGLMCSKCGVRRRYVKSYLLHVASCQGRLSSNDLPFALMTKDMVECAICSATMEPKAWRNHAMKEHYNIAWVVGDNPIEINNPYAVEGYLKEYQLSHSKLVCKVCKISRVSYVGFYAHIIVCGKSDEETEIYKSTCELCNNKYLRIYKSQHMTMHREKELAKERRLLAAKAQELKREEESSDVIIQTGRRKAAEKAKNVIEKYKKDFHDGIYHCAKCGFNSEIEKELSDHVCVEDKWGDASDSDESVKLENCSGDESDESDESDIDSNVSDEEQEAREQASTAKKKKHSDSSAAKICRIPYQINNPSSYMKKSTEEFIDRYFTDEDLFPLWRSCELEEVPENELVHYMPPIEESCKVRFEENQDWSTFNRLESSRVKEVLVMFLGASVQCMSWVPATQAHSSPDPHYLSAAAHRGPDAPRHAWDATLSQPGLIQIWDCGNMIENTPEFVLGIAHDFGTVWAIDWCPSGARDAFDLVPEAGNMHRLGLMAAACSNGLAYIFAVLYPSSITKKKKPFYKLKPVAELRLTSKENRKAYQATAIKWSVQKGHSHVVVGYADGTTAYYDLKGESPLLRTTENNRTVFYPYHDERVQNSCIEDMDIYPSAEGAHVRAGGVVVAGGAGGAGAGALQSHLASSTVLFPPHWPAALLAGEDCLVNQSINELEWWGGGRRLGGSCGAAACAWCGRVAVSAPPLLRLMRAHPCFPDLHKQIIARILMVPFGGKRKRQNDELAMIVEPIAYDDAVKKYGVEFKQINTKDRSTLQKLSATPRVAYPERFPLSDVAAMKFCPTLKQHHKLAVAMHAGLVVIINV